MYVVALVAKIGQACVFRCCGEMLRSRGQEEPKPKNKRVIVTTGADSLSTYARKHKHVTSHLPVDTAAPVGDGRHRTSKFPLP